MEMTSWKAEYDALVVIIRRALAQRRGEIISMGLVVLRSFDIVRLRGALGPNMC